LAGKGDEVKSFIFARIITNISCLITLLMFAPQADASCTWEDQNGIFHMTDDRSQAPRNARCDGDSALIPRKSGSAPLRAGGNNSGFVDLGYDDDANHYSFDVSEITLKSGSKSGLQSKMTEYNLIVPVSVVYQKYPSRPNTADVFVKCGILFTSDGTGVQTLGRIDLPKGQARLLRRKACERFKP
jgi:hypothetical protein